MTEFSPEKFEDKYANYFPELQTAYKNAFETMNDRYDSGLIHAIDQQVLNESEPFYEDEAQRASERASGARRDRTGVPRKANGEERPVSGQSPRADGFRIELPENPNERITDVLVNEEKLDAVLTEYVEILEVELANVFDLDGTGQKG